jgi:hypothetical protein
MFTTTSATTTTATTFILYDDRISSMVAEKWLFLIS